MSQRFRLRGGRPEVLLVANAGASSLSRPETCFGLTRGNPLHGRRIEFLRLRREHQLPEVAGAGSCNSSPAALSNARVGRSGSCASV